MNEHILIWVLIATCMVVSFVLSGMEAGVFALSRLRIRQHVRAGRASAKVLLAYLEAPENFLWTILVGNTLANFALLGWLIALLHRALRHEKLLFVLSYSICVFLFYTFFDLLPKMLFRTYPNRFCMAMARPFRVIHLLLRPLVAVVESFSDLLLRWRGGKEFTGHLFGNREELRLVMQESGQPFTSEERTMINKVLDLQVLTVRQAMKPLTQVVSVPAEQKTGDALALCCQKNLSRLPVRAPRGGGESIIGVITVDKLIFDPNLDLQKPVAAYVRPALYLEEDLRLEVALRRLQRSGERLALVLGRERAEVGIITLQDVLRVIFGEVSL